MEPILMLLRTLSFSTLSNVFRVLHIYYLVYLITILYRGFVMTYFHIAEGTLELRQ